MTTVIEVPRIHTWLRTVLGADATLVSAATGGIWRGRIPHSKPHPAVVFQFLAANEDQTGSSGATRVWSVSRYIVKAVTAGNSDAAGKTIADRIDAVLHAQRGGADDIAIDYCVRKKPIYYLEDVGDETFIHMGGEYEIAARYAP